MNMDAKIYSKMPSEFIFGSSDWPLLCPRRFNITPKFPSVNLDKLWLHLYEACTFKKAKIAMAIVFFYF